MAFNSKTRKIRKTLSLASTEMFVDAVADLKALGISVDKIVYNTRDGKYYVIREMALNAMWPGGKGDKSGVYFGVLANLFLSEGGLGVHKHHLLVSDLVPEKHAEDIGA